MSPTQFSAVEVVHHGEDFHAGVFRLQERHHPVVDRENRAPLHDIEELVGLIVDALQSAVGREYVQPVGIQDVDLAGVGAQRRETGRIPGHIESRANPFSLIQRDLRSRQFRLAVRAGRQLLLAVAGFLLFAFLESLERRASAAENKSSGSGSSRKAVNTKKMIRAETTTAETSNRRRRRFHRARCGS